MLRGIGIGLLWLYGSALTMFILDILLGLLWLWLGRKQ